MKKKHKQYYHHLIKNFFKFNQLPSYFIFYPTSRCNLKCYHCFYHDSLNKKFNELSVEELNNITKTMDPILHLILTGGEPYLRKDLDKITVCILDRPRHRKIIDKLKKLNVKLKLISDGDVAGALLVTDKKYNIDIFIGIDFFFFCC